MVCVPCFIIPVLLYVWHRFVQPILLRYWNPWEKKDAQGNVIKAAPEFPFECKGGVCPFVPGGKKEQATSNADDAANADNTNGTNKVDEASDSALTATAGDETKKSI